MVRKTVALVIVSICLTVSFLITALYTVLLVRAWFVTDEIQIDPEYAMYVAEDEVITRRYDIQRCRSLHFFDDSRMQKTIFVNAVPNLKIVSDGEYYVEVTTNQAVHDALQIESKESVLTVSFREDLYNRVYEDDVNYDYAYGLYVDCTQLDITVHTPICFFYTDTNLKLDFEMAPAEQVYLDFSFEGLEGRITNIDTKEFTLHCSGKSRLKLEGNVSVITDAMLWHDTRVDARNLKTTRWTSYVSHGIGGFSYWIGDGWNKMDFGLFSGTALLEAFIYIPFAFWLWLEIRLIKKRKQYRT